MTATIDLATLTSVGLAMGALELVTIGSTDAETLIRGNLRPSAAASSRARFPGEPGPAVEFASGTDILVGAGACMSGVARAAAGGGMAADVVLRALALTEALAAFSAARRASMVDKG